MRAYLSTSPFSSVVAKPHFMMANTPVERRSPEAAERKPGMRDSDARQREETETEM